jgi:hypothetical protein
MIARPHMSRNERHAAEGDVGHPCPAQVYPREAAARMFGLVCAEKELVLPIDHYTVNKVHGHGCRLVYDGPPFDGLVENRAAQESEIPNFKGSYLGRFPLVLADFWTSDHLSERSQRVDAFF